MSAAVERGAVLRATTTDRQYRVLSIDPPANTAGEHARRRKLSEVRLDGWDDEPPARELCHALVRVDDHDGPPFDRCAACGEAAPVSAINSFEPCPARGLPTRVEQRADAFDAPAGRWSLPKADDWIERSGALPGDRPEFVGAP